MAENVCPQCGAPIDPFSQECKYCGEKIAVRQVQQQMQQIPQQMQQAPQQIRRAYPYEEQPVTQMPTQNAYTTQAQQPYAYAQEATGQSIYVNPVWPVKNKYVAGVLGIFFGTFGVHKFYMGKIGMGIFYLCFSWTGIPTLAGFIEGIIYICSSDESFQRKNQVRVG